MISWERQDDETEEWYDGFRAYLSIGHDRTVVAAHMFATRLAIGAARGQLPSWRRAAQRYRWKERAAEYDADHSLKALGGDDRLRMVVSLLEQVYRALCNADISTLPKEEVRQLLPTFRLFFRDLLQLHQSATAQMALGKHGAGSGENGETGMNADDLESFFTEPSKVRTMLDDLKRVIDASANESSWYPLRDVLAALYPDEASTRRIADQAQLEVARIHFAARAIDRWHALLTEAAHAGLIEKVIQVVRLEYGANPDFVNAVRHYHQMHLQAND